MSCHPANCVGRRGAPRHGPVLLLHDHGLPLDTHQVCRGPGHSHLLQRQLASQTLVIQDGEIKHKADHFAVSHFSSQYQRSTPCCFETTRHVYDCVKFIKALTGFDNPYISNEFGTNTIPIHQTYSAVLPNVWFRQHAFTSP